LDLIIDANFDIENNNWLVKIDGEVDLFNSAGMKSKLLELLEEKKADLVIDCRRLDYIDSTALGVLVSVLKHAKNFGCDILLKNVKSNIKKLFKITNLDIVFKITGDNSE